MMNDRILIIAGMHRSGTSLIAQWLYRCGLHLGDSFLGPDITNADGHFEDPDFVTLHENLLQEASLPFNGLTDVQIQHLPLNQRMKVKALLDRKSSLHSQFGWKDPRTCLFLQEYREWIPEASYLIVIRDFNAVVHSLVNRIYRWKDQKHKAKGGLDLFLWNLRKSFKRSYLYHKHSKHFLKVWIAYNKAILKHIKLLPENHYMAVHYEELKSNDKKVFDHLVEDWNFNLHYVDFNKVFKGELIAKPLNIKKYIKDRQLVKEAQFVQQHMMDLLPKSSRPLQNSM